MLSIPASQPASAGARVPSLVRIGLYSNSPYTENKAESSYRVYSDAGISVGFADDAGNYSFLYDFIFTPTDTTGMYFSKYAFGQRYAAVTGRDAGAFDKVAGRVSALQKAGYDPQLAFLGGWTLIAGFYDTREAAQKAIDNTLAAAFPDYGFTAEELSGAYILITKENTRQFIFDASAGRLRASPTPSGAAGGTPLIDLNGKSYRGAVEFVRDSNGHISAVNLITMNDYLYGVVPREIQASSSAEALKAQAVAARTYAVNTSGKHGPYGFDMCSTTHCQVYGGYTSEDARTTAAVDGTSGHIVTYNGAPAQVFYFSSSGGHTENVKNVWNSERDYPYLCGVEDPYESGDSYRYNWETVYTAKEIAAKLSASGSDIGDVTGVAVTRISEAGRATEVTITGTKGKKVYTNDSCRTFLGNLHSQWYTVFTDTGGNAGGGTPAGGTPAGGKTYAAVGAGGGASTVNGGEAVGADGQIVKLKGGGGTVISGSGLHNLPAAGATFRFVGKGWGHAVGMSQEGAKGMAAAGFSYTEILLHYFPGCAVG